MCEHEHQTSMKLTNNPKKCALFLSFFHHFEHSFLSFQWRASDTMSLFLVLGISGFFSFLLRVVSSINENVLFKLKRKKKKVSCYCLRVMRITFMSSFRINNTEYGKNMKMEEREGKRASKWISRYFPNLAAHGTNNKRECVYMYDR